jgi:hypothetical protein
VVVFVVGGEVGETVGTEVRVEVGAGVGSTVGSAVGFGADLRAFPDVGAEEDEVSGGSMVGTPDGMTVGAREGTHVGRAVGNTHRPGPLAKGSGEPPLGGGPFGPEPSWPCDSCCPGDPFGPSEGI